MGVGDSLGVGGREKVGGEGKGLKEAEGVVELPICRNSWKEINSVRSICKKSEMNIKRIALGLSVCEKNSQK